MERKCGMTLLKTVLPMILACSTVSGNYTLPDTDQSLCFDTLTVVSAPQPGEPFFGQDAQYSGLEPSYIDNGNGTVTDLNTGLMWQQQLPECKMTWDEAMAGADTCSIAGYTDWRLPTIKELYSLILFSGTDPSGPDPGVPVPFIDTEFFEFEYGDTLSGDRLIDAQYWSSTQYTGLTMNGDSTTFGVNFADGRIKGYPSELVGPPGQQFQKTAFVRYVRGNAYGQNDLIDNGDGTVTDQSTGLMWQQADDGTVRNWLVSLDYAENLTLAGHDDWRLPNAHELQSIVDYSRSVQSSGSPAIDPVFNCTQIIDEGGNSNYGFYWTGTTHKGTMPDQVGTFAVYIAFGEGLGWMMTPDSTSYELQDVHGAGCQRSDPKAGDPDEYPYGHGPQGDVVRIDNFVRCVRNIDTGIEEGEGSPSSSGVSLEFGCSNPVAGQTLIRCNLARSETVDIAIYDLHGRRVSTLFDGVLAPGTETVVWETTGHPDGIYTCVLRGCEVTSNLRITVMN
jgi:hypothetical protein